MIIVPLVDKKMIFVRSSLISGLFLVSILQWQCSFFEGEQHTQQEESSLESVDIEAGISELTDIEVSLLADTREISQSLEKIVSNSFSFEKEFPLLFGMLNNNPDELREVQLFAEQAISRASFSQETDLLNLMEERDTQIIPLLLPYFESMDSEMWDQNFEALDKELGMLGIQMTSSEGIFTGLGPGSLFTQNLKLKGKLPVIQYDAFTDAHTRSLSGEYPYSNIEPFVKMVLLGENLRKEGNAKVYYEKIGQSFAEALHVLTDVHLITNEGARVGGINVESYPHNISIESIKESLPMFANSQFKEVIERIVEFPSEMTSRPENLYLLVESWVGSEEEAQAQVEKHLYAGKDIPHYLPVEKGDGKTHYAIVYRFFEDADQADTGLKKMQTQFNTGEMVFVSSEKNKLYQLGY